MPVDKPRHHVMPWYRHRWPWLLMLMPASAVCVGSFFIWQAVVAPDTLVQQHYYAAGQSINTLIQAGKKAQQLGLTGSAVVSTASGSVIVRLHSSQAMVLPPIVLLQLSHPTLANRDQHLTLLATRTGQYHGVLSVKNSYRWNMLLLPPDKDWSLAAQWRQSDGDQVVLLPTAVSLSDS